MFCVGLALYLMAAVSAQPSMSNTLSDSKLTEKSAIVFDVTSTKAGDRAQVSPYLKGIMERQAQEAIQDYLKKDMLENGGSQAVSGDMNTALTDSLTGNVILGTGGTQRTGTRVLHSAPRILLSLPPGQSSTGIVELGKVLPGSEITGNVEPNILLPLPGLAMQDVGTSGTMSDPSIPAVAMDPSLSGKSLPEVVESKVVTVQTKSTVVTPTASTGPAIVTKTTSTRTETAPITSVTAESSTTTVTAKSTGNNFPVPSDPDAMTVGINPDFLLSFPGSSSRGDIGTNMAPPPSGVVTDGIDPRIVPPSIERSGVRDSLQIASRLEGSRILDPNLANIPLANTNIANTNARGSSDIVGANVRGSTGIFNTNVGDTTAGFIQHSVAEEIDARLRLLLRERANQGSLVTASRLTEPRVAEALDPQIERQMGPNSMVSRIEQIQSTIEQGPQLSVGRAQTVPNSEQSMSPFLQLSTNQIAALDAQAVQRDPSSAGLSETLPSINGNSNSFRFVRHHVNERRVTVPTTHVQLPYDTWVTKDRLGNVQMHIGRYPKPLETKHHTLVEPREPVHAWMTIDHLGNYHSHIGRYPFPRETVYHNMQMPQSLVTAISRQVPGTLNTIDANQQQTSMSDGLSWQSGEMATPLTNRPSVEMQSMGIRMSELTRSLFTDPVESRQRKVDQPAIEPQPHSKVDLNQPIARTVPIQLPPNQPESFQIPSVRPASSQSSSLRQESLSMPSMRQQPFPMPPIRPEASPSSFERSETFTMPPSSLDSLRMSSMPTVRSESFGIPPMTPDSFSMSPSRSTFSFSMSPSRPESSFSMSPSRSESAFVMSPSRSESFDIPHRTPESLSMPPISPDSFPRMSMPSPFRPYPWPLPSFHPLHRRFPHGQTMPPHHMRNRPMMFRPYKMFSYKVTKVLPF